MHELARPFQFDPAVLRDAAGGDDTLVRELFEIFLRIVPPMVTRLRAAIAMGHTAAIADEAHSLRSCLATVGADQAEASCRQLEAAARRGEMPVGPRNEALCACLERLITDVRDHYATLAGCAGA